MKPRFRSRIALRIFAFNALLVFLPVASLSLLGSYERGLVDSLEQSLAQQARITAAWLGQEATSSRLDSAMARHALAAIGDRRTARFRVVDALGRLLADSSDPAWGARTEAEGSPTEGSRDSVRADIRTDIRTSQAEGEPLLYRLFSIPARLWRHFFAPPSPPLSAADYYASTGPRLLGSEVVEALDGRYGAATRVSSGGQVSVTLYSAVPVVAGGRVAGAVLVSQSTYRILRDLYSIRLDIGRVVLVSLVAAAALSLLLALTIVGPLRKLGAAAAASTPFPESRRGDEIGDLQRALRSLMLRLDERVRQTERFAADAAHEFRNPLAAIRSAAELAADAADPTDRSRLLRQVVEDTERLRAITEGLRRLSLVEGSASHGQAAHATDPAARVDVEAVVLTACERARTRCAAERGEGMILFEVEPGNMGPANAVGSAAVDPTALEVILDNLLGNAASFAKSLVRVTLDVEAAGHDLRLVVEDDGPGIPPEHLIRVFDRFFTWRPGEARGGHTGLGLSLALALARAAGGNIEAGNRPDGGARFVLHIPLDNA